MRVGGDGGALGGTGATPSLRRERELLREGATVVAGMDEVGRGALAGPVSVGVVAVTAATRTAPSGLRDSKLLTPAAREALVPRLRRWAPAWAVGHAEADEVDAVGIVGALRLAGQRALAALALAPDVVLLDGNLDWLNPRPPRAEPSPDGGPSPAQGLLDLAAAVAPTPAAPARPVEPAGPPVPVRLQVKADLRCAAVAAASVLAKVERDALMVERSAAYPVYRWHENKGYSAPEHCEALAAVGPCPQHRRSWRLPGVPPLSAVLDLVALEAAAPGGATGAGPGAGAAGRMVRDER